MKHLSKLLFSATIVITASITIILFSYFDDTKNFKTAKSLDIFYSLFTELNQSYVEETDPEDLITIAIDSMLTTLDPYTQYIPQAQIEQYRIKTHGEYGGVGAVMTSHNKKMIITEVYKNSPAHNADLRPGDIIAQINNHPIINKTQEEVEEMLQGEPGTIMNIDIQRQHTDGLLPISITREKIHINSIPFHGLISPSTGYIKLKSFTKNSSQDVEKAYKELKDKGAQNFVLDLRDNPGGLLFEAIQVVNLFIPKNKKVVYTRGKNSFASHDYYTQKTPIDTTSKLIVLINDKSASASEIVSGSIQDFDRGIVIGEQSYGKGLVQAQRKIAHNSILKVTVSKYYIPSGRCIQKIDYSDKNKQENPTSSSDSKLSTFYTQNGRPVKDGGGIIPDIKIPDTHYESDFQKNLLENFVFLNFTAATFTTADTIKYKPKSFTISEDIYSSFVHYVDSTKVLEHSKKMQLLTELQTQTQKKSIKTDTTKIDSTIIELRKRISQEEHKLLQKEQKGISQLLGKEIMQYLYFAEGAMQYYFPHDPYIQIAKKYFAHQKYNDILSGKKGTHKK
ncbi:MAG: S41 family peptidase [Bacteroidales bacterium]